MIIYELQMAKGEKIKKEGKRLIVQLYRRKSLSGLHDKLRCFCYCSTTAPDGFQSHRSCISILLDVFISSKM